MKVTYLVSQKQADGSTVLAVSTKEEVLKIYHSTKNLPDNQRRCFITDYIYDGSQIDCIVYETTPEKYREYNREHMASERNRKRKGQYRHISLSSLLSSDDDTCVSDRLADTLDLETSIVSSIWFDELKTALAVWKPWALDLFYLYMNGDDRKSTKLLAEKYHVSEQVIRKYKRQFKEFMEQYIKSQ